MYSIIAFLISIIVVLLGAKKHIEFSLLQGASLLGIITPSLSILFDSSLSYSLLPSKNQSDKSNIFLPSVVLLAVSVALIPLIGGILEKSGQMDRLVNNMRLSKKATISSLPAILGMLLMPGERYFPIY